VVTLAGNTTVGGTGRWDIRGTGATLSTGGKAYDLTKVGFNQQFSLVGVTVDPALGNIDVQAGLFSVETTTTSLGDPAKTLTIESGATLQMYQLAVPLDKVIVLNGDGFTTTFNNNSGVNGIAGSVSLVGACLFNAGGTSLTLTGPLGGSGSLTKNGGSPLTLAGAVSYSGDTLINGGTLALAGSASLASSPNITLASGTGVDVTGRTDGTLTLVSGQTLTGDGAVQGSLQVNPGATVSPGSDTLGFAIAQLTVANAAAFAGTNAMQTDKSNLTNDVLRAASITYGGTLRIADVSGVPYVDGDTFKLFDAAAYSGAFTRLEPPNPASGLFWDTSTLTTDGTLRVTTTSKPTISSIGRSGPNLVLAGTGGPPNGTYWVLVSTNIALPLAEWAPLATNTFDASGSFSFTNGVPSDPRQFYLLEVP
jgi:autotransporter-associated beta strand protein